MCAFLGVSKGGCTTGRGCKKKKTKHERTGMVPWRRGELKHRGFNDAVDGVTARDPQKREGDDHVWMELAVTGTGKKKANI